VKRGNHSPLQALTSPVANRETFMDINPQLISPLVALAAGILILIVPRLLNYIVAIYLIVIGVAGLMGRF
jgi:hypothetical protein